MNIKTPIEWKIRIDMEDGRIFVTDKAILLHQAYAKIDSLPEKGTAKPARVLEILDQPTHICFGLDDLVRESKTSYLAPGDISLGYKYITFLRKLSFREKLFFATWKGDLKKDLKGALLMDGNQIIGGLAALGPGKKQSDEDRLKSAQDFLKIIPVGTHPKAEAGCVKSQELLAFVYSWACNSNPEYDAEALKWLLLAAKHGEPKLQHYLGLRYRYGRGVPKDLTLAAKWFKKSADQNHPKALRMLGILYCCGAGVPQDDLKGALLIEKAISLGDVEAIKSRSILKKSTPAVEYQEIQTHIEQHLDEWRMIPNG